MLVNYKVTDISVTTSSDAEFAEPPENGYFLIVSIEGATTPALAGEGAMDFYSGDFVVLAEGGTRINNVDTSAAWSALDDGEQMPAQLGPGQRFSGKIALDVPVERGFLIYIVDHVSGTGHEWTF